MPKHQRPDMKMRHRLCQAVGCARAEPSMSAHVISLFAQHSWTAITLDTPAAQIRHVLFEKMVVFDDEVSNFLAIYTRYRHGGELIDPEVVISGRTVVVLVVKPGGELRT